MGWVFLEVLAALLIAVLLEANHSDRFWAQLRQFEPAADTLHRRMRDAWKLVPIWAQRGSGALL